MNSEWWSLLQDKDLHEANRSLVFRMLARSGAEYERLLSAPHRRAPILFFLAIDTPTVIPVTKASPPCLLGEFTRSFLAAWELDTPEARAMLVLILLSAKVDTAKIECRHAWWRRLSVRLETQTHLPDVLDLCSRALVVRMRHRDEKLGKWASSADEDATRSGGRVGEEASAAEEDPKRRRGGGGPWRYHVSKCFKAGNRSFAEAAASYRERSEAQ